MRFQVGTGGDHAMLLLMTLGVHVMALTTGMHGTRLGMAMVGIIADGIRGVMALAMDGTISKEEIFMEAEAAIIGAITMAFGTAIITDSTMDSTMETIMVLGIMEVVQAEEIMV